jgi:hypothetical protein
VRQLCPRVEIPIDQISRRKTGDVEVVGTADALVVVASDVNAPPPADCEQFMFDRAPNRIAMYEEAAFWVVSSIAPRPERAI